MSTSPTLHFPDTCRYTTEHIWIRPTEHEHEYTIGISDFAQEQLGEIAFVDLPTPNSSFQTGDEFGTVESLKSVNSLYMPVDGQVLAVNEELESTPTLINISAYEKGWMLRLRTEHPEAIQALLDAQTYQKTLI